MLFCAAINTLCSAIEAFAIATPHYRLLDMSVIKRLRMLESVRCGRQQEFDPDTFTATTSFNIYVR